MIPRPFIIVVSLTISEYEHMLHERQAYVRRSQYWFTDNIPAYTERVSHLQHIYAEESSDAHYSAVLDAMRAEMPGRAFYAVILESEVPASLMQARGAELVYENDAGGAHVYLLNPDAADI